MSTKINIALAVPSSKNVNRYIAFRLKKELATEPCEFYAPPKIVALSDIEGNFLALRRLLIKNSVINNKYNWTFGEGHLVIVGDCFDRGDQVIECLWLIYSLEEKAKNAGGYIHLILGNHEIMNLNGDLRYVHPKYAELTKFKNVHTALYDGNSELWRWLRTKNIIEKIGNTIFVHGGIAEELLKLNISIPEINMRVQPFYTKANNLFTDPLLSLVFNSNSSPFWYRGYYQPGIEEAVIDATLEQFEAKTIVTGHTVVNKIRSYYNGKVINIDTDHASGNSEALFIVKDRFYRLEYTGKREKLK